MQHQTEQQKGVTRCSSAFRKLALWNGINFSLKMLQGNVHSITYINQLNIKRINNNNKTINAWHFVYIVHHLKY